MIQGRLEQPYRCGSFFPFPFLCFFVYPRLIYCVFLFFSGCHKQNNFNVNDQPCRISRFRVGDLVTFSRQTNDRLSGHSGLHVSRKGKVVFLILQVSLPFVPPFLLR
jgi:hypothetical protein